MKCAPIPLTLGMAVILAATSATGQPKPAAPAVATTLSAPSPRASALPPRHPPVGDEVPSPAPGVDDDEAADPHAGVDPRFFNPPEDVVSDDPSLPVGTIVVTIKDAQDKPIARAPVTLGVLHSTVAKGDSTEHIARDGDEVGSVRFEGLAVGSGHTYRVSTTRGPATYAHAPFSLTDKVGKRVTVHSYEVSGSLEDLPLAMQGMVYVSLREDSIQVEQLLSVYNLGPVAWVADMPIQLPKGFKAFNKQDAMDDARVEEVPGAGAAIRGTFPPGRRDLDFRYQVPLDDEAKQTLRLRLPQRVAQARVIAEASRSMMLEVTGFPPAKRVEGRDGKRLLVTEQQVARATGGLTALDITLSGLPTLGPGRWIAVALAIFALGSGIIYFTRTAGGLLDADAQQDLAEARDALLGEIVALERAHQNGEVGPKTYARVRSALLDALARIVAMIEAARSRKNPAPHRAAGAASKPAQRRMEASE
jgi:hypothetical protein